MKYRAADTVTIGGRRIVHVEHVETGERTSVYFRLGRWRNYKTDSTVPPLMAAAARRALARENAEQQRIDAEPEPIEPEPEPAPEPENAGRLLTGSHLSALQMPAQQMTLGG